MRHINAIGESNYDLNAFRPDPFGRIGLYGGGGGKSPDPPPPPPPPAAPPAEVKDPNVETMVSRKKAQSGATPPPSNTMLTGSAGIDQNSLNLGKNNLLGG